MSPRELQRVLSIARQVLAQLPPDQVDHVRGRLRTVLRKSDEIAANLSAWDWRCEHAPQSAFITVVGPPLVPQLAHRLEADVRELLEL